MLTLKAYSTHSAAKPVDVPIGDIMVRAGWRLDSTFAIFYDRPVQAEASANAFAHAVLSTSRTVSFSRPVSLPLYIVTK